MDEQKVLVLRSETSWGKVRAYPVNETAKLFCDLMMYTSLSQRALKIIAKLGYTIEFENQKVSLEDIT